MPASFRHPSHQSRQRREPTEGHRRGIPSPPPRGLRGGAAGGGGFLLAAWLLALVAFALAPRSAGAEPRLVESLPTEDATVTGAPTEVELFFLEPVPAVVVSLIDRRGAVTPLAATIDPVDARHVVAPLPDRIGEGPWTIGWSVPDAEGRPVAGTFAFRVAGGRIPGAAVTDGQWPQPWAVVVRWLAVLGTALAAGVALLGLVGRRVGAAIPGAAGVVAAAGATVALLATAAEPVLGTVLSSAAPLADAFAAMAGVWWLRLVALVLLALLTLGLLATRRAAAPPASAAFAGIGLAVAALVGLGLSGHAASADGAVRPLGAVAEVVCIVSLALFAGSLVAALVGRVPRSTRNDQPDAERAIPTTGFARLALPLGLAALVAGAAAAAFVLPRPENLWGGGYGWLLLLACLPLLGALALTARAGLVHGRKPAAALAFAAGARLGSGGGAAAGTTASSVPVPHSDPDLAPSSAPTTARGTRSVPTALKLAAPLALVALLTAATLPLLAAPGTETPQTLARLDLAAGVPLGPDQFGAMQLSLAPAVPGETGVVFELEAADGTVLPAAEAPMVDLTIRPLDHPGEERTVALTPDRFGGWATGAVDLSGAGWWQADVTLVPPAGQRVRVPFWFVLPDPNVTGRGPTPSADPAAEAVFDRAIAGLADLRSVRYTQRLSDGSGSLYQSLLEVTDAVDGRPAAFAERSSRFQSLVVGDTQWVREAGETSWRERAAPSLYLPSAWAATYAGAEGFRLGPVAEVDGAPCRVVTFYLPRAARSAAAWFAWWVDEETGMIRRETMVSNRHYMVYSFGDLNEEIRIEPPVPEDGLSATPVP
jgi:methionine-rich copper-binding protein CopC